jgi:hypothetical protein
MDTYVFMKHGKERLNEDTLTLLLEVTRCTFPATASMW